MELLTKTIMEMGDKFNKLEYIYSMHEYIATGIFKTAKNKKSVQQTLRHFSAKDPLTAVLMLSEEYNK